MKQRSYCLDVLKLVLSYVIAFFHFGLTIPPGPSVTVQVFFLISGFFLGQKFYTRSLENPESYTAWDYTRDHVRRLYPYYLFALVVYYLYALARDLLYLVMSPSVDKLAEIALDLYNQIPDVFLMQSSYRFFDSLNYPLWQISAMLIAGYFLYALLCWREKLARRILLPASVFFGLSLMNTGVELWANWGGVFIALLRAFYPMALGVLTSYFIRTSAYQSVKRHRLALNLASLYCLATLFAYGELSNIFLITVPILIVVCCEEGFWLNRLFQRPCFRFCGKFSYAVYVNHALIARFTLAVLISRLEKRGLMTKNWQQGLLFFVLLTVYSVFTMILVDAWQSRCRAAASTR